MSLLETDINTAKYIYNTYLGIKSYFYNNYNYFKYNNKLNKKFLSGFEDKSKEIYNCLNIYNKYKDLEDIEKLLVLNIKDNSNFWLANVNYKKFQDFKAFTESSEYRFKQQLKNLTEKDFEVSDEYKYSKLYYLYLQREISEETLIIVNLCTNFLDKIKEKDFLFEIDLIKFKQYQKFIEKWNIFDVEKFKNIIKTL